MHYVKKSLSCALLIIIMVIGFALAGTIQVSAEAPGVIIIIDSDTTWTKADSPHIFTGPVLVEQGVTLTIEAGSTVDLNGYELRVNGTLRAIGTSRNRIQFKNGTINFTEYSNPWNEETGSGSIIQFAFFDNELKIVQSVPVSINEDPIGEGNVWKREDSPFKLSGPMVVDSGETLTIEAGVTVNLMTFELIVEGTLRVLGSSSDKVYFKLGEILFTEMSDGWDEEIGSGCMIDNAVLDDVRIVSNVSLKITNSNIMNRIWIGGSSILTGNKVGALYITGGSPIVSGNDIMSLAECYGTPEISNNTINYINNFGGSPVISGNAITQIGHVEHKSPIKKEIQYFTADSPTITNNIIENWICLNATGQATISYNNITGHDYTYKYLTGIGLAFWYETGTARTSGIILEGNGYIFANTIEDCDIGIRGGTIIEGNLLINNRYGLEVCSDTTIRNNTFTSNAEAIRIINNPSSVTINYNNFENSTQNSIYLMNTSNTIDATNNWWGTTDPQAINLTIHDYKYEFGLGKVNFVPFLTEPNPKATPSEISEFPSWLLLPLFLVATFAVVAVRQKIVGGNCTG
jgi:hypothetical protein